MKGKKHATGRHAMEGLMAKAAEDSDVNISANILKATNGWKKGVHVATGDLYSRHH